jgi:multicomponent Na+:H+ antiporter subunit F
MRELLISIALLLSLMGGLARVWRGPTAADRMLAAQLFGTTGVATLLLLSRALADPRVLDVALVIALLAVVSTVAFVRSRPRRREGAR